MPHPCSHACGWVSDTSEERARHERCCPERFVSCCQNATSCSRKTKAWAVADDPPILALCRHGSNGLFGAVREDNADLVQHFLSQLKPNLVSALTHESKFGDTILTHAASLGRCDIVRVLLKAIQSIVEKESDMVALSDLVDFETSRGKSAIGEAAKNNHADVVAVLLAHHGNAKRPSKIHHKSPVDWSLALGHHAVTRMINTHVQLEEHVHALFKAASKFDVSAVKALTEGGIPYEHSQDALFRKQLESKRRALDLAKQSLDQVSQALREVDQSKEATRSEIQERETRIACLERKRADVESRRRNEVSDATARVHQALTSLDISQEAANPPLEYELICKALCTLLHIKAKSSRRKTDDGGDDEPNMPHWKEIQNMLQESSRFFHRIRHYPSAFEVDVVDSAAKVEIDGLPGTCSDHLSSILQAEQTAGSSLMVALARWLWTMFQHADTHRLEHSLLMEASDERDVLERLRIDFKVLTSRNAILKRERDDTKTSIDACTNHISQLERKMEISRMMSFVVGGHSILSWAAGVGNEEIVKTLLKRGAHTAIGDDCFGWCATLVQIAFRRHLQRRERRDIPPRRRHLQGTNERMKRDLAFSLRMASLSNLIRERLKSMYLPLAEALFNGHHNVVSLLKSADIPPSQALNLSPMFRRPQGMLPRPPAGRVEASSASTMPMDGSELFSYLVEAGQLHSHGTDPRNCIHADSLKYCIGLFEDLLRQRRQKVEEKISKRRDTLHQRYRSTKAAELTSAIQRGDVIAMVRASEEGNISLDYEDATVALTPLIRATMQDIHAPLHNSVGENCTAVAYLLDRISPHRPSVDYENGNGHTALATACMNGRGEVARELIDRGADVDRVSTMLNCTAYDLALDAKQLEVVAFLDRRRSKPK